VFMLAVLMPPKLANAPLSIEMEPVVISPSLNPCASISMSVTSAPSSIDVTTIVVDELSVL